MEACQPNNHRVLPDSRLLLPPPSPPPPSSPSPPSLLLLLLPFPFLVLWTNFARAIERKSEPRQTRTSPSRRSSYFADARPGSRYENGGVVFTWSREHIDSRTRRQIGFCALFPFAPSLFPLLPFCRRRSFHPLIAHRPSMSYLPRLVDGHIYGELYAMLFGTDNRGDVSTNVLLR